MPQVKDRVALEGQVADLRAALAERRAGAIRVNAVMAAAVTTVTSSNSVEGSRPREETLAAAREEARRLAETLQAGQREQARLKRVAAQVVSNHGIAPPPAAPPPSPPVLKHTPLIGTNSYFNRHFHDRCDLLRQQQGIEYGPISMDVALYAVIGVHSLAGAVASRNAVRETWGKAVAHGMMEVTANGVKSKVRLEFVIATPFPWKSGQESLLQAEALQHQDIVLLPRLDEGHQYSYAERTKVWFQRVACFYLPQFVIKVSDDTHVRIDKVIAELQQMRRFRVYWGSLVASQSRASGEVFNGFKVGHYMPYMSESIYTLSGEIVDWLAKSPVSLKYFRSEAVSVGMWVHALDIKVDHDERFVTKVGGGCPGMRSTNATSPLDHLPIYSIYSIYWQAFP
jgi:hypothetical protein